MPEHISPVDYKTEREPDYQYHELLERIRHFGKRALSGMDQESIEVLGHQMTFNFVDGGFPLITERDLSVVTNDKNINHHQPNLGERPLTASVKQALGEILAFMNGARTQEELEAYGCKFWKPWTSDAAKAAKRGLELGDLGPGSYGAAFHDFPTAEGDNFNQFRHLVEQIKERPELRTHVITPFIPQYIGRGEGKQQKVLVVPCHGLQHYNVDTVNQEISLVHWQRSADVPIGLPFNMVHYAALTMMVGQVTGLRPRQLVHQISNAHIYKQHIDQVDELLTREPRAFPILKIDPSVKRLEDFRIEHFSIAEYDPHPPMDMGGTAV
ncbi:MAG TPA: thymidylate synthase [Candidatus Saccharimonadales bacterium]|nr:thymidylate synthase [Candidatus Saccharimonadales bacterium]